MQINGMTGSPAAQGISPVRGAGGPPAPPPGGAAAAPGGPQRAGGPSAGTVHSSALLVPTPTATAATMGRG